MGVTHLHMLFVISFSLRMRGQGDRFGIQKAKKISFFTTVPKAQSRQFNITSLSELVQLLLFYRRRSSRPDVCFYTEDEGIGNHQITGYTPRGTQYEFQSLRYPQISYKFVRILVLFSLPIELSELMNKISRVHCFCL
jgi:hypothetical protein